MLGINQKINDSSLYVLSDMIDGTISQLQKELEKCSSNESEKAEHLKVQIAYNNLQIDEFKADVDKQREEMFQFAIEELYFMYGQYESRYIGVEFHKYSESAREFGRNIGGVIFYTKSERERLDALIKSGQVQRTNGMVRFETSPVYGLAKELINKLQNEGFISGDIFQVMASNIQIEKSYNVEGIKEIPNTMNINFDATDWDPHKSFFWLFSKRIQEGGALIESEWSRLCGYSLYYQPESVNFDFIKKRVFDGKGKKHNTVKFYELSVKIFNNDMTDKEILEFLALLKARTIERTETLKKEIKRSTNKSLEKFVEAYPKIYNQLETVMMTFEDETLEYDKSSIPIFWDFKSYLHIFLRHCDELQIEGHFKEKTAFQYTQKDIKRILEIAVRNLKEQINERLIQGKDFRVSNNTTLYFNGNYYMMRVEKTGRVDSFSPMEIKKL